MSNKLRIVFMGTPEFAVPSLQILIENNLEVVGVITAPDKKSGRGQKISRSAIKEYALSQNLNILQPTNLKSEAFLEELKALRANLQIVVAFRMLPQAVWSLPQLGTFNLHGSLLPQYRGAAPINWAIINGEKETGVTTFFLKHEIDTGDLIEQQATPINPQDNVGTLYARLMDMGSKLVLKTVRAIETNTLTTTPQSEAIKIKHAPKLFKDTCQIDWRQSADSNYNFIRGLSPYPAAWTQLKGKTFKIYKATKTEVTVTEPIQTDNKTFLHFACSDYYLNVEEVQLEGKKRMKTDEFLRGYTL